MNRTQILSAKQIQQKLNRIAWQIFESNYQESIIIIAGINGNGFVIAQRLASIIKEISDSNFNRNYIAKFEDAHNIQLILDKLKENESI